LWKERKEKKKGSSKLTDFLRKSDSLTAGSSERYNGGLQQMEEYRSKDNIGSRIQWNILEETRD